MKRIVAIVTVGLLAVAGCSGGSDGDVSVSGESAMSAPAQADGGQPPLAIGELQRAIEAVRAAHPGETLEFTEINVQRDLVNLFLARPEAQELAYVWQAGELVAPDGPQPQPPGARLFGLDGVDPAATVKMVDLVAGELPNAVPRLLTLVDSPELGLSWVLTVLGEKGEDFSVGFTLSGGVIGAVPSG